MKKSLFLLTAITVLYAISVSSCKKDKKTTEEPSSETKYALVIDNGAQSMEVGKTMALSAHLVSSDGAVVSVSGVSWSSSIGGISGANFSLNNDTVGVITASVDHEGKNYKASIPISVQPLASTLLFGVVPSAIIWSTNSGDIQLNTVYLGTQSSNYSFSSDNSGVASVSNGGMVSFKSPGSANIKVTANIGGQTSIIIVPVLVVGMPEVPLPVTRVVVSPALGELFRGETLQLNAKAYNSNGDDVTSTVSFNYVVVPKLEEDEEPSAPPISVDGSGKVSAISIGDAYVKVTASGVMGQSEIIVNPDTVIMVTPFFAQLGGIDFSSGSPVPNPTSQVFTATTYKVDRAKYRAKQSSFMDKINNPSNLTWILPLTGIPQIDDQFNVVDLSNKSNTSVTATAKQGKFGSTFIIADAGANGGGAGIMVMP